jgi:uncharacterized protein YjcR
MKLIDYLRSKEMRPDDLAEMIGNVSVSGVRKWISGERIPRRDQMEKIVEVTAGEVLPNDFFDLPAIERVAP